MLKKVQCWVLLLASLYEINAFKYLVVSPIPTKSHAILGEALVEHISNAGHEVTYITSYAPENVSPRVTVVHISENIKCFPSDDNFNVKTSLDGTFKSNSLTTYAPMMMNISRATISDPKVQKLMADRNQQFDAVIAEWMYNEVYAGFAGVFNCPLIWFSSVEPHWMVLQLVDEIPNPAYTANFLSVDSVPPLTLKQRVIELYVQITGKLLQIFWLSKIEQDLYDEFFVPHIRHRENSVPSFDTLRYNGSLILSNSHVSMAIPLKLPANVINIGGYHIKPNLKPLPKDLQELMDNAKHGVIYFSMGSHLRSKKFPDEVKEDLLRMFGKLKQTIIWKFEEELSNRPSNVHILHWAPQQSILGHKNCILFITHGGLLSTTETMHYGVPTIGIPVFADQFVNVARAVKKGYAQKVDLTYSIAANLETAIKEILDNPKYKKRVKELSQIYHDRTVPAAQELVHWVEHVVKTKGATHLRSPAFMVPWYQKLYLDVILVLLVTLLVLKYVFIFTKKTLFEKRKEKFN